MPADLNERAARALAEARIHRAVGVRRRRRQRLPRQIPPRNVERDYARELVALVVPAVVRAFAPLMAELPALLASARRERGDAARRDAGEGRRVRELVDQASGQMKSALSTEKIDQIAKKFAARTETHQRVQLGRQVRAAFGADVFIGDRALRSLVENFAAENVALIRGVVSDVATRVEKTTISAVQGGMLHGDLAKKLEAEYGYTESRSILIARDQVGKLYGQINASRQKELGAEEFIWRTVHDERVRDEHEEIDGERFSYADGGHPTEGLPGEPILCRCYAEPIFPGVNDE